jgi:hypothetical protein
MRTILAKINILANAFEKDGNLETAELLHDVFVKISKKKKSKSKKNVPNNPSLWASCQAWAKANYDVHPSAYSNAGAARRYKAKGGTWRKASVNNTRLAQEIDTALDPKVREEQNDIKDKQTLLSGAAAGDKLRNFILKENGDFQYLKTRADDFIQTLNVNPEVIEDLKNFAIYFIRLKINEPTLDESLYNDALNALINAKNYLKISEINTHNIYSINNYLRKMKLVPKVYFTALEMARLKSTGQAPGAQ